MKSSFGIEHGVSKRDSLVPPEGRPSKYAPRIENVRAAARNKSMAKKPGIGPEIKGALRLVPKAK